MNKPRSRETALITGASAGIGQELARVFAEKGHDVVLVARSEGKLHRLAARLCKDFRVRATVIPADLSAAGAAGELFEAVEAEQLQVDTLVNNAGVAFTAPVRKTSLTKLQAMMSLNIVALTELTRLFVEPMVERKHGRILNLASIASFQPIPTIAVYAASKAYVLSLSEAMSAELEGTGVTVTALCPGFTETDMLAKGSEPGSRNAIVDAIMVMSPEPVARAGYEACMSGKALHVTGLTNRAFTGITQLAPRWLIRRLGGLAVRN